MKRGPDAKAMIPPHLNDAQIIACLDGELPTAELQRCKTHLESCWVCRSRSSAIQASVESFVRSRQSLLPKPTIFDDSRVEQFRQRLGRHARESEATLQVTDRVFARFAGLRTWLASFGARVGEHRQAVIASAMAACLLIVMFSDMFNTRVSADTLLRRAETYESAHSARTGQVTRSSVRIERIERRAGSTRQMGSITVLHDPQGPTYVSAQSGAANLESLTMNTGAVTTNLLRSVFSGDTADTQILQYLEGRGWLPEVSVTSFRGLVEARNSGETSVTRNASSIELHYPFASGHPSGISEAMLTLDDKDFSPVQLSIFSGTSADGREYRFTRTAFSTEPRELEVAHLGTMDIPGMHANPSAPSRKASPLSYVNSTATAEEVAVAAALHKADACLGEEIYLFPMSDGSLLVQGLVDGPARRTAIRESLKGITGPLRLELFVPRELKNGSELYAPPDEFADKVPSGGPSYTATLADLSSAKMPLYDQLYKHFVRSGSAGDGVDKQIAVFSNEVVTLARQTFLHAWALKKLDREFSSRRTGQLDPATLARIEEIRQDHRRWISNLAHQQAEMLSHISDPAVIASLPEVDGIQDSSTLLRLAQEQNDLVRSLFTASTASPETAGSLSHLLSVLQRMGS